MKKAAVTFFVTLAMVVGAQASTITVTNLFQGAYAAGDSGGAAIPKGGGYVAIGTFSIDNAALQAAAGAMDRDAIQAGFTQFADSLTMGNLRDGYYQGTVIGPIAAGDAYEGNQVYSVIGNGSSILDSTSLIVYQHADVAFQPDPNATPNAALNAAAGGVIVGTAGTVNSGGTDVAGILGAPMIPEPSTALLGLLGLTVLGFRRRR